jgi:hypothetical protein
MKGTDVIPPPEAATEALNDLWERFWSQVDASGDCWEWTGRRTKGGYGGLWSSRQQISWPAHRLAWELLVGPIDEGLHIDHLCRHPPCVNPDHLEPVTPAENQRRAPRTRPIACPQGHPYGNPDSPIRNCPTCRAADRRRARQRQLNTWGLGSTKWGRPSWESTKDDQ